MEEVHSTRTWRKKPHGTPAVGRSAFDDAFGGPPRHAAPFSVRIEDYSEVFGAAASVSSIPVLDLPPADDGFDAAGNVGRRGGLDYSEIFGGFGDGDFAVSYEELFAGPKRSGISSMDRRVPRGVLSEEQANDNTVHSLEGYSKDHVANLEMGLLSIDKHSDDVSSKQFSMSYHKTSQKIIDDVVCAKTHTTKLDAIPGFTVVVDANDPLLEMKSKAVNGGIAQNTDAKRYIPGGGQENEALFNYPFSAKNCVYLKADQKPSGPDYASKLDVPGNEKQHSRSSSYHSTSSGDIPFFDAEYLKVSEISLQTKPLQGPPPSRPPPMLIKKPEHPDMMHAISRSDVEEGTLLKPKVKNQLHLNSDATKIHAIDESVKDHSCCYDAELVPSSAAAASAAAIKEAMEQAQARLKRAKELMDRKRDKHHRKVVKPKVMNGKEDVASYEIELKSCSKLVTTNNLLKENNSINECKFLEKEEIRSAEKTVLNQEEKKRQLHSSREDQQQVRQDNGFKSPEVSFKSDEITGESKSEKNFCELISNVGSLNTIEDVYILGNEKKAKPAIYAFQDKEKDREKGEQTLESEENQKLSKVSCSVEMSEIDNHLNCAKIYCMKESEKTFVDAIMEEVLPINNANELEEAFSSNLMDENQKPSDVRLDDTVENEVNKPNPVVHSCLCKENVKRLQASNIDFKIGVDEASLGEREFKAAEEREFKAAEEVSRNVDYKEEFNVTYMNCGLNDSDKELKVANGTVRQSRFEKEIRVPDGRCKYYPSDTKEVAEETKPYNNNDDETKSMKHQCSQDLNRCRIEENYNVAEEGDGLQTNEGTCISAENELEQEAIHDFDGLEKLKAQGKQKDAAIELLTSRKETSWEYRNDKETKDAQMELQEDEEWMGARTNQVPQNFDFLTATDEDCANRESENITEVAVICKLKENQISSYLSDEVCQDVEIEKSDAEEVALSRKEGNSPAMAPDATEVSHIEVTENSKHSLHCEEENRKRMDMERERDKELVVQLEEKEREREREKDRIAVERANYEARQRSLAEARERAERIAVERATAEARQRALAEAREKAEKAAEAEKVSRELRLKAERAAVGRATEEARQRAIEKALAEKAAAEARSRMRKDIATSHFKAAYIKEDSETRQKFYSTEIQQNSESGASSTNGQRYAESSSNGESESNLRCKARQERQQRTAERAAKALAEKNMRDILAQREQSERDRFADSLDIEVKRWSSGKDGNLRALLSTLQYILGPDSGWKPISLTDVITAADVKKAYRKATLCVHPDKLQQRGATIQQKYICGKVFDLLKEAWSRFNSEER